MPTVERSSKNRIIWYPSRDIMVFSSSVLFKGSISPNGLSLLIQDPCYVQIKGGANWLGLWSVKMASQNHVFWLLTSIKIIAPETRMMVRAPKRASLWFSLMVTQWILKMDPFQLFLPIHSCPGITQTKGE